MTDGTGPDGSPRRRASWSLSAIVEDVAGKPLADFQDPERPVHPYVQAKLGPSAATAPAPPNAADRPDPYDPVAHVYPPLVGAPGRAYHGPEHEHHPETLERHAPRATATGEGARPPGPLHRPERLYLHYLLLHMDRLSDTALRYLRTAVEEETAHRARPASTAAVAVSVPETPVPPPTATPAP